VTNTITRKLPETGKVLERSVTFETFEARSSGDTFVMSWSSEYPVDLYWYKEILSHEEGAISTERVAGMTLLWNHDRDVVLGKIERVWIENKKAYCEARWSQKASIQEYRHDMEDGIITNASFLYTVQEYKEIGSPDPNGEGDYIFLGTRWTPYEISLVSVPADPTVGVGRALSEFKVEKDTREENQVTIEVVSEARETETARVREILALGEKYGQRELSSLLVDNGTDINEARRMFLDKIIANQDPVAQGVDTKLGLSEKDQRNYSLIKAINAVAFGKRAEAGFELECSDEIATRLGRSTAGFFMPVRDLKAKPLKSRATFAVGANDTGGFTVQTDVLEQQFIDLLRNKAMIMQLGATMLSGLTGNVDIPGQATAASTYWIGEGGNITQSEGTFRQVPLRLKTVGALSRYTRTMMMQTSIDIEQFIRNDFSAIIALAIDSAAISGSGSSNQPRGILNTPGIGSVALGTNGAAPAWASIVNLIREIEIDNANLGSMSWLTNPQVMAKLMTTSKQASGVEGNFILSEPGNSLIGYPFYCTNQVPSNLTKGTGTGLSALILGNWSQVLIGEWGVFEVLANPYSDAVFASGSVEVRAMQSLDINLRQVACFSAITDMITT
jgi:HK97 family phage major capsid protein